MSTITIPTITTTFLSTVLSTVLITTTKTVNTTITASPSGSIDQITEIEIILGFVLSIVSIVTGGYFYNKRKVKSVKKKGGIALKAIQSNQQPLPPYNSNLNNILERTDELFGA